ncbi:MAG: winged helix-turn-helix domain-containing protein [bacterium]|nr:winged helix-turn-helix domain-containing protein [bacterium]
MSKHILASSHTLEELLELKNKSSDEGQKLKLRAIINIKKGKLVKQVAEDMLVSRQSLSAWQRIYNSEGVDGLLTNRGGRPEGNPIWDKKIFTELTEHVKKTGGYWSVPLMQKWIERKYSKTIPLQTIWYHVCLLEFSYKSARPHPYKGDPRRQASFKKGALSGR